MTSNKINWSILAQCHNIEVSDIEKILEMKKREELLKKHYEKHKPWLGKDGRWYVAFDDRTKAKKKNKEDLDELVLKWYENEGKTLEEVAYLWIEYKEKQQIQSASITRYENRIRRYLSLDKSLEIKKMRINSISETRLNAYIYSFLDDGEYLQKEKITQKEFSEFISHLKQIYIFAKRNKYIDNAYSTLFDEIDYSHANFRSIKKTSRERTYSKEEIKKIKEYAFKKNTLRSLSLVLLIDMGCRVGELVAISKSDIHNDFIQISKTETHYTNRKTKQNTTQIKDSTKTENGFRILPITKDMRKALDIMLELSSKESPYLISESGKEALKEQRIRYEMSLVCKELLIDYKATHSCRRAYASKLIEKNAQKGIVMKALGHSNIETTLRFYYEKDELDNSEMLELKTLVES